MANLVNTFSSYSAMQSAFNRASSFLNLSSLESSVSDYFSIDWSPTSVNSKSISARSVLGDSMTMYGSFSPSLLRINIIKFTTANGIKFNFTGNVSVTSDETIQGTWSSIGISLGSKQLTIYGVIDAEGTSFALNKIQVSNGADSITLIGALSMDDSDQITGSLTQLILKSGQQTMTVSGLNYQLTGTEETIDKSFLLSLLTGNDVIQGGAGNDLLDGGAGADQMNGMQGNDTYYVDNLGDVITDSAGIDKVVISTLNQYTLADYLENLAAEGAGNFTLNGNTKANNISGSSGNDTLDGSAGADTLSGGAGDDEYYVENAKDSVIEKASAGNDSINSSVSYSLPVNVENLTYVGVVGATLNGNASANIIIGGESNDTISGGKVLIH